MSLSHCNQRQLGIQNWSIWGNYRFLCVPMGINNLQPSNTCVTAMFEHAINLQIYTVVVTVILIGGGFIDNYY